MPFVVDASVALSWCFEDEKTPYTEWVLDQLNGSYALVPPLWVFEVVNALAMAERRGRIARSESEAFLARIRGLDLRVDPTGGNALAALVLPVARTHRLTGYDAAYLELAKRRGVPLATFDREMMRAAPVEGVALLRP